MKLHELELLAPAGRMDVLHSVIEAGADAVYWAANVSICAGCAPSIISATPN